MHRQRAASGARALLCAAAAGLTLCGSVHACQLILTEQRSGRELQRLPLDVAAPGLEIAFEHSVLGTTVIDRYVFRLNNAQLWQAWLIEERFDGQGYGLPHEAGPGEQLLRDGKAWRLLLDRPVQPLVVRPLPAQRMRLLLPDGPLLLSKLSDQAVEIQASDCKH